MLSQRRKLDFWHAHFLCEFRAILGGGKAAETPAQLTCDFLRCKAWAAFNQFLRLSYYGRTAAARTPCSSLHFVARLPQDCCERYDKRTKADSGRAVILRQLCDFLLLLKVDALRPPNIRWRNFNQTKCLKVIKISIMLANHKSKQKGSPRNAHG